jgi:hypothetical protein
LRWEPSHESPDSVSCEDGICVPEGQEKWMYDNCVQFFILVCGTSSPGNEEYIRVRPRNVLFFRIDWWNLACMCISRRRSAAYQYKKLYTIIIHPFFLSFRYTNSIFTWHTNARYLENKTKLRMSFRNYLNFCTFYNGFFFQIYFILELNKLTIWKLKLFSIQA